MTDNINDILPLRSCRKSPRLKRFRSMNGAPYTYGDFIIPLDNGDELVISVHEGIELGAWLMSQGIQIALETAESSLDKQGRGIR